MGTSVGICFRKEPDYSSRLQGGWQIPAAGDLLSKGNYTLKKGGGSEAPRSGSRAGCFRVVVPPHVLRHLTDRLIDSFKLHTFSLVSRHPSEAHGGESKGHNGLLS